MSAEVMRQESWPAWAKALLVAMVLLGAIVALPWIFMWTTMATTCIPFMNNMRELMSPGMMR